jgi:hypothetical protein
MAGGHVLLETAGGGGAGGVATAIGCDATASGAGAAALARHVGQSFSEGGTSDPHLGHIHVNIAATYCSVISPASRCFGEARVAKQASSSMLAPATLRPSRICAPVMQPQGTAEPHNVLHSDAALERSARIRPSRERPREAPIRLHESRRAQSGLGRSQSVPTR